MKTVLKAYRPFALALGLGLAAPLFANTTAQADSTLACATLSANSANGHAAAEPLKVVKTEELHRFQQRPYMRIPEGVALTVRAPRGMTAADLHNLLTDCRKASDASSPLCVQGAAINVQRSGGHYVVRITSDVRSTALEVQRRAARM